MFCSFHLYFVRKPALQINHLMLHKCSMSSDKAQDFLQFMTAQWDYISQLFLVEQWTYRVYLWGFLHLLRVSGITNLHLRIAYAESRLCNNERSPSSFPSKFTHLFICLKSSMTKHPTHLHLVTLTWEKMRIFVWIHCLDSSLMV